MNNSIIHNNKKIFFTIERRNRRTTAIQVHPDQSVRVLAPRFSTERSIRRQVAERAAWIAKKQDEFSNRPKPLLVPEYREDDEFSYLGKLYQLQLCPGKAEVKLDDEHIIMTAPADYDSVKRKKLLQQWYRRQSKLVFAERFNICIEKTAAIGITQIPAWSSRVLRKSWGSCSAKGNINLNLELVSASISCIDYVIIHEMCHLIEHNHSPRFYKLMDKTCPDWKLRRNDLRNNYPSRLA